MARNGAPKSAYQLFVTGLPESDSIKAMERIIQDVIGTVRCTFTQKLHFVLLNFQNQEDLEEVYSKCIFEKCDGHTIHIFRERPVSSQDNQSCTIVISNLPPEYQNERVIFEMMKEFGNVKDVRMPERQPRSPRIRVVFNKREEAQQALLQLRERTIGDRQITIERPSIKHNPAVSSLPSIMLSIESTKPDEELSVPKIQELFPKASEVLMVSGKPLVVFTSSSDFTQSVEPFSQEPLASHYKIIREVYSDEVARLIQRRRVLVPFCEHDSEDELRKYLSSAGHIVYTENAVRSFQFASEADRDKALLLDRTTYGNNPIPIRVFPYVHRDLSRETGGLIQINEMPLDWDYDTLMSHFDKSKVAAAAISRVTFSTVAGIVLFYRYEDAYAAKETLKLPNVILHAPTSLSIVQNLDQNELSPANSVIYYNAGSDPLPKGDNVIYATAEISKSNSRTIIVTFTTHEAAVEFYKECASKGKKVEFVSSNPYISACRAFKGEYLPADWNNKFLFIHGLEPGMSNATLRQRMESFGPIDAAMMQSSDPNNTVGINGVVLFRNVEDATLFTQYNQRQFRINFFNSVPGYSQQSQRQAEAYRLPQAQQSTSLYLQSFITLNCTDPSKQQAMIASVKKLSINDRISICQNYEALKSWYEKTLASL